MSTLAIWFRVVQSRHVSPHNFDGLAMSVLAISVAPLVPVLAAGMLSTNTYRNLHLQWHFAVLPAIARLSCIFSFLPAEAM